MIKRKESTRESRNRMVVVALAMTVEERDRIKANGKRFERKVSAEVRHQLNVAYGVSKAGA